MNILNGYIIGAVYAAVCLLLATVLYKLGVNKKYTRKLVHILIGFEWIILNYFIGPSYHLLLICLGFLALLLFTYMTGGMKMISSDADNAPGTVYFCISMSVMSLVSWLSPSFMVPFGIAVFCTSLSDGFAGVVGQAFVKCNPKIWLKKTLLGTLASLLLSVGVVAFFDGRYSLGLSSLAVLCIAAFATLLELFTGAGFDNVTLPLGVFLLSYGFIYYELLTFLYIVPILLTPLMLAVVLRKKVLTPKGTLLAVLLDLGISIPFGNIGFIMMALFLVGGVLSDKIKRKIKAECSVVEMKSDKTRDSLQVVANGLVPFVCGMLYLIRPHVAFFIAFASSAAEALSDTFASSFGALSSGAFDLFKMKKTEKGMSGGMSLIGTAAAALGALIITLVPTLFGAFGVFEFVLVFSCAFFGNVFDSLLGSLIQGKFRCPICGKLTEGKMHCNHKTERIGGLSFVNNDLVNFLSSGAAALSAFVIYLLF